MPVGVGIIVSAFVLTGIYVAKAMPLKVTKSDLDYLGLGRR